MRNIIFLLLTALLFSFIAGCNVVEETTAGTGVRPEKVFEDIWVVQEKDTQIEITADEVSLKASCSVKYEGTSAAQDVSIIIKSPLTADIIEDDLAQVYDTVNPGDVLEYTLDYQDPDFRGKVPLGSNDNNLIEDFENNSYLEVNWKEDGEDFNVKIFNWDKDNH
ncbi:MAG: hypothetical protein ACOX6X_07245 [Dethiobacteria bacterium]|jgi:multidrug efflux pump subunit AcrA (membrane-fusion protein)